MFQLTAAEHLSLRSQIATSKNGRGGRRYLPFVFTEHGAIQAANVVNSPRAAEMGIYVVRAFVQLRELLSANTDLARRLDQLEARIEKKLAKHDDAISAMLSAIRQPMNPPVTKSRGWDTIRQVLIATVEIPDAALVDMDDLGIVLPANWNARPVNDYSRYIAREFLEAIADLPASTTRPIGLRVPSVLSSNVLLDPSRRSEMSATIVSRVAFNTLRVTGSYNPG